MSRLGIIVPDDGPLDYELYRLEPWLERCGIDVSVRTEDSYSPGFGYGDAPDVIEASLKRTGSDESLLPCARRLVEQQCEAILWACTSGSFAGGYQWARDQANRLRRETDRPCTSTTLALIEAVHALDWREVDLLSTYPVFATERLTETLSCAGITVIDSTSVDGATDHSYGKQADFSYQLDMRAAMRDFLTSVSPNSDRPILVPNTSVNTLELVEDMEQDAKRPVITANQASVWHALELLGFKGKALGAGSLFDATIQEEWSHDESGEARAVT